MTRTIVAPALLWCTRLAAIAALVLGVLYWSGQPIPIHAHMGCGGLAVLSAWGLAGLRFPQAKSWASLSFVLGLLVPALGLAQTHLSLGAGVVPILHVAAGLALVAASERLSRPTVSPAK